MFVGISVSELFLAWGPGVKMAVPFLLAAFVILVAGLPLLSWCWSYIDRCKFDNMLQRRLGFMATHFFVGSCLMHKGQRIHHSSWSKAQKVWEGELPEAKIKVATSWQGYCQMVHCEGSYYGDDTKTVTVTRRSLHLGNRRHDSEPMILIACCMLGISVVAWPLFIIAAAAFVPVYLLRAARDGQKLAIKVKNHIADKEAHKGE